MSYKTQTTPFPIYPIIENKTLCRVCKKKLRALRVTKPSEIKSGVDLTRLQLHNRAVCSPSCLFEAYDDFDRLTDELYEVVYKQQEEIAKMKVHSGDVFDDFA